MYKLALYISQLQYKHVDKCGRKFCKALLAFFFSLNHTTYRAIKTRFPLSRSWMYITQAKVIFFFFHCTNFFFLMSHSVIYLTLTKTYIFRIFFFFLSYVSVKFSLRLYFRHVPGHVFHRLSRLILEMEKKKRRELTSPCDSLPDHTRLSFGAHVAFIVFREGKKRQGTK